MEKLLSDSISSTPLLQDWLGDDAEKRKRREIHFPTGRFGEAIEQAYAVLFLASDESSFVNGTDFMVDGGLTKVCQNFGSIIDVPADRSRHIQLQRALQLKLLETLHGKGEFLPR